AVHRSNSPVDGLSQTIVLCLSRDGYRGYPQSLRAGELLVPLSTSGACVTNCHLRLGVGRIVFARVRAIEGRGAATWRSHANLDRTRRRCSDRLHEHGARANLGRNGSCQARFRHSGARLSRDAGPGRRRRPDDPVERERHELHDPVLRLRRRRRLQVAALQSRVRPCRRHDARCDERLERKGALRPRVPRRRARHLARDVGHARRRRHERELRGHRRLVGRIRRAIRGAHRLLGLGPASAIRRLPWRDSVALARHTTALRLGLMVERRTMYEESRGPLARDKHHSSAIEDAEGASTTEDARKPYGFGKRVGFIGGLAAFVLMLLVPPPPGLSPEGWRTAAVAVLMAVWWMTEAIPIPATALLPLVLFPLLDVLPATRASTAYANEVIFLFMGGLLIA